jgi:ABC-type dipeptide/oligopeptide/nickel transport system ATPase component
MSYSLIIQDIRNRLIHYNKNWLCMIIGETGSGKSYCALRIAELINPDFPKDASKVYFSVKELIEDMQAGVLKKGDVAILDETGVSFSSRKWWSVENRNFGFLLQAVRHRNFAIIFCLPSSTMMDKAGRLLMHTVIQTQYIDRHKKVVITKWKNSRWDDIMGKMWYQYVRVKTPDGRIVRVTKMAIHRPSEDLVDNYEAKKKAFTQALMDTAKEKIGQSEEDERLSRNKVYIKQAVISDIKEGRLRTGEIAKKNNTSSVYVSMIRRKMADDV